MQYRIIVNGNVVNYITQVIVTVYFSLSPEFCRKGFYNRISFKNLVALKHHPFLIYHLHKAVPGICGRKIFPNFPPFSIFSFVVTWCLMVEICLLVSPCFVFSPFLAIVVNFWWSLVHTSIASVVFYVQVF